MTQHWFYLVALLVSLGCTVLVDRRFQLALFFDVRRTVKVLALGLVFFCIWDLLGIYTGIFLIGDGQFLTGLRLAPEFPIEEIFFLILLEYSALLLWRYGEKRWPHT